jgi:DNA-binding MarR family transcriptional regulator
MKSPWPICPLIKKEHNSYEWIRRLIDRGLLLRLPGPNDERIALIDLSDEAAERMRDHHGIGAVGAAAGA